MVALIVILLILWATGVLFDVGALIHLLLAVVVIVVLYNLATGKYQR